MSQKTYNIFAKKDGFVGMYQITVDAEILRNLRDNFYDTACEPVSQIEMECAEWMHKEKWKHNEDLSKTYAVTHTQESLGHNINAYCSCQDPNCNHSVPGFRRVTKVYEKNELAEKVLLLSLSDMELAYNQDLNFVGPFGLGDNSAYVQTNRLYNSYCFSKILKYEPQNLDEVKLKKDFCRSLHIVELQKNCEDEYNAQIEAFVNNNSYRFYTPYALKRSMVKYTKVGGMLNALFAWSPDSPTNLDEQKVSDFKTEMDRIVNANGILAEKSVRLFGNQKAKTAEKEKAKTHCVV